MTADPMEKPGPSPAFSIPTASCSTGTKPIPRSHTATDRHWEPSPYLDHHEGLAVAAERVLQQVGQLGVAEGHVALPGAQSIDDVPQRREGLVDVLCLTEPAALRTRPPHTLRSGQVYQVELPWGHTANKRPWLPSAPCTLSGPTVTQCPSEGLALGPTCGAQPCAAVKPVDGDNEESVGAGAVLVQVGTLCCTVDVAELKDLAEPREMGE